MELNARLAGHMERGARLQWESAELLAPVITTAARQIVTALLGDRKVLACGEGAATVFAQYFAAQMLNRYRMERPGLASIALGADNSVLAAISEDMHPTDSLARQVLTLGAAGDVLLALSPSGNSEPLLQAVRAAHERDMGVLAITGSDGGRMIELLRERDLHIGIPSEQLAHVLEIALTALHCLCDAIDCVLLGVEE